MDEAKPLATGGRKRARTRNRKARMNEPLSPGESDALAALPAAKAIMDTVRPMLPAGTDFGVFVLAPGDVDSENRVIAITTDRRRVGFAVAQWFVQITRQERTR
jgi:hypothetical protein